MNRLSDEKALELLRDAMPVHGVDGPPDDLWPRVRHRHRPGRRPASGRRLGVGGRACAAVPVAPFADGHPSVAFLRSRCIRICAHIWPASRCRPWWCPSSSRHCRFSTRMGKGFTSRTSPSFRLASSRTHGDSGTCSTSGCEAGGRFPLACMARRSSCSWRLPGSASNWLLARRSGRRSLRDRLPDGARRLLPRLEVHRRALQRCAGHWIARHLTASEDLDIQRRANDDRVT